MAQTIGEKVKLRHTVGFDCLRIGLAASVIFWHWHWRWR
jgi:hypothetical protein